MPTHMQQSYGCTPPRSARLIVQVAATLQYAHANDVTPFMEPVLELCLAVLTRERREAGAALTPRSARRCRKPAFSYARVTEWTQCKVTGSLQAED
jgi:hypothetical protein